MFIKVNRRGKFNQGTWKYGDSCDDNEGGIGQRCLVRQKKEFSFQQELIWAVGLVAFRSNGGNEPGRGLEFSSFLKWNYHE